jgi:hypothetical protein
MIPRARPSHVRFVSGLFFLAVALLLATGIVLFTRVQSGEIIGTAKKGIVSEQTLVKNYTTHYPVFHDAKLDAIVGAYVKGQVDAFEKATENKKNLRNHLVVDYEIQHYGSRTATLTFVCLESIAGQPDQLSRKNVTLDLGEKREIGVKDIL